MQDDRSVAFAELGINGAGENSRTSLRVIWLPGLVSQSVVLWDRVQLEWMRMAKSHLAVHLAADA